MSEGGVIDSEEQLLETIGSFDFLAGELSEELDDEIVTIDDCDDDGFTVVIGTRGLTFQYPLASGVPGLVRDLRAFKREIGPGRA